MVSVRALNHASADGAQRGQVRRVGGTPTPDALARGITDRAAEVGPLVRVFGGTLKAYGDERGVIA